MRSLSVLPNVTQLLRQWVNRRSGCWWRSAVLPHDFLLFTSGSAAMQRRLQEFYAALREADSAIGPRGYETDGEKADAEPTRLARNGSCSSLVSPSPPPNVRVSPGGPRCRRTRSLRSIRLRVRREAMCASTTRRMLRASCVKVEANVSRSFQNSCYSTAFPQAACMPIDCTSPSRFADGPSHAAYSQWKRTGIPTNEVMQSTTFGLVTRKGDTAGDALSFAPQSMQAPPPLKQYQAAAASRPNPITWDGAQPEGRPGLSAYANAAIDAAQREAYGSMPQRWGNGGGGGGGHGSHMPPPQLQASQQWQQHQQHHQHHQQPSQPPTPAQLSPNEMQETWGQLMRSGKMRPSAAQCMVEMPPDYSYEAPNKPPAISSQSLLTIGLHGHEGPVKRSSAFTSDFRDPFM